jgi:YgiT-type zinc finger domain-containing protein
MTCFCYKNGTTVESKSSKLIEYSDNLIIIRNIPCLVCKQCGEKYFKDDVMERLEMLVTDAKKTIQEVSIIDYTRAA